MERAYQDIKWMNWAVPAENGLKQPIWLDRLFHQEPKAREVSQPREADIDSLAGRKLSGVEPDISSCSL